MMLRVLARILALCVAASLALVGSCHWQRAAEQEGFRRSLPPEYRDGQFIKYDVCDRLFGSVSYIFKLSQDASDRLRNNEKDGKLASLGEKTKWNYDGMTGLMCLQAVSDYRLVEYFNNSNVYGRKIGSRHVDYFIPSEGIVVGGSDPR